MNDRRTDQIGRTPCGFPPKQLVTNVSEGGWGEDEIGLNVSLS